MVHGAIYKHEGQISVFNFKGGPTYRCYNPYTESREFSNPLPADVGLLGVLPGITGTFMANEVIKIITGSGNVLSGKVLMFNIYDYTFNIMEVTNIPENHNITKMNDNY
jgi:adenylyltransferase/sulfurtransferase